MQVMKQFSLDKKIKQNGLEKQKGQAEQTGGLV